MPASHNPKSPSKQYVACILHTLDRLYPHVEPFLTHTHEWDFLFAVMLSAQTTDKQVNKVTPRLFHKYNTLAKVAAADEAEFAAEIASINHYKTKAKRIIEAANLLITHHQGKVPKTIDALIALPGVGRKTANVVLSEMWGKPQGMAVDTHVARLARLYGLSTHSDPERIEADLMRCIPKTRWATFPMQFISYGREYCPARCKSCPACPLWSCIRQSS